MIFSKKLKSNDVHNIANWFNSQYIESIGFSNSDKEENNHKEDNYKEDISMHWNKTEKNKFSKKFISFIEKSSFPKKQEEGKNYFLPLTGSKRMESFLYLKLKYSLNREGYTCGVLWATIGGKRNTESHYAYVYWKKEKDLAPLGEPPIPEFISISPTFDSRDGEYRKRFIKYETFLAAYDIYGEELRDRKSVV